MKLPSIASTASPTDIGAAPAAEHAKRTSQEKAIVDPHRLQQLADKLAESVGMSGQQVQFSVDHDTGKTVLRVTDAESGALLRQIPGDEALAMARILDNMKGVLIREKA